MSLYMGQTKIPDVRIGGGGGPQTAVLYTEQNLEEPQKEQARQNIGATDISLGLTGMSVGDKIEVASVDENGVPTGWKPEGRWELIEKISLPPETIFDVSKEPDGTQYNFKSVKIMIDAGRPATRNGNLQVAAKVQETGVKISYYMNQGNRYFMIQQEPKNGYVCGSIEYGNNHQSYDDVHMSGPNTQMGKNFSTDVYQAVRRIYLPNGFEETLKIEVWAVR